MGIHHYLYSWSNISRAIKKKKVRWARYVACLGKKYIQFSKEKEDGKRHAEDRDVDGGKKVNIPHMGYLYPSFNLEDGWGEVVNAIPLPFYPLTKTL